MAEETQTAEQKSPEFNMVLNLNELNVIFASLQEGPFKIVQPIMAKIQEQVNQQAQAQPAVPVVEAEDAGINTSYKE